MRFAKKKKCLKLGTVYAVFITQKVALSRRFDWVCVFKNSFSYFLSYLIVQNFMNSFDAIAILREAGHKSNSSNCSLYFYFSL